MKVLLNQTSVHSPMHNKANFLTRVVVKESAAFIVRHQARGPEQLVLKKPELSGGFQQSIFEGKVREGSPRVCD